ncbi:mitotic checkpoint serine/threonine-protein kinase BUB1 beta-like [Onychostruthus taczanowskii]|uniref:mitotic checkpoint serine/threonine-protein kinase BUB1 beta-like n=1 Tax=Onychostruthus taczanowskii TaxID=356909 RepID=UPI001B807FCE|nr:mitotic checkpoint serine/threonine-protein kinase BUB1 beta-like [Onychostruthus taczanowskii]
MEMGLSRDSPERPSHEYSRPRSAVSSALEVPHPLPSFTPYVDESAEPQMMTPCKIEPSINCVLSTRKAEEREDPLQRVQQQQQAAQAKKEMVMYCKEKVYAGVDEFSFEEIRAEIYRKKARKKDEDEIQAIERKKEEIQRKIEELEQKLKKKEDNKQQQPHEQAAEVMGASTPLGLQGFTFSSTKEYGEKQPQSQSEFQVYEDTQLHKPSCSEDVGLLPPPAAVPFFSIFDESSTLTNQNIRQNYSRPGFQREGKQKHQNPCYSS